jgi:predicted MPP superfamily phosphohydrolase
MFKILLSHDPTFWESTVLPQKDIDLTLSGHTHAWQFRLWGISPSMLIFRQWAGLYTAPSALAPAAALSVPASSAPNTAPNAAHAVIQKLFVSTGSGGNIPFRFGSWPEIDILTLRRRPSASRNVLQ